MQELAKKIGMALEYLHDGGIILKNLESGGILMTESEDMVEKAIPRISRFNKAEIMGYDCHVHGIEGDIRFRAPEVLQGKCYDFKADSWSFGVVLFHLYGVRQLDFCPTAAHADTTFVPQRRGRPLWPT